MKSVWYDRKLINLPLRSSFGGVMPWEAWWMVAKIRTVEGNILEIGTHIGGTTRGLASEFPNRRVFSVDKLDPAYKLTVAESGIQARNMPNVTLFLMDSKDFPYSKDKDIGVIFIDGDHSYAGVKSDTVLALAALKERGRGTIIWHDCSLNTDMGVGTYVEELSKTHPDVRYVDNTSLAFLDFAP